MIKVQPVVVVYNTYCGDSKSVSALLHQGINPIIVDNSTKDFGNHGFCVKHKLQYISMGENAGLSKAYNMALKVMRDDVDYILWLDDDTELPLDYSKQMMACMVNNPGYDLYIPIVKTGRKDKGLLSPNIIRNFYTYRIDSVDDIGTSMFSAINSGMIVSKVVYENYKYDENLFLDCIDHDFMVYCWNNKCKIYIMKEVVLTQNFSGDEKPGKKNEFSRFRLFMQDFRWFRKKNECSKVSTEFILLKRAISILVS